MCFGALDFGVSCYVVLSLLFDCFIVSLVFTTF